MLFKIYNGHRYCIIPFTFVLAVSYLLSSCKLPFRVGGVLYIYIHRVVHTCQFVMIFGSYILLYSTCLLALSLVNLLMSALLMVGL